MNLDEIRVFSFDIFDTAITRWVARPTDLFFLMQRGLRNRTSEFPAFLIEDFWRCRVKAELRARIQALRQKRSEIALEDIYRRLKAICGLDTNQVIQLMNLEKDLEYQSICPIAWTWNEIRGLKQNGRRVIFTSDTYLPASLIESMLSKVCEGSGSFVTPDDKNSPRGQVSGYDVDSHKIYISNALGLKKHSGELFHHILKEERCQPHELCHCGDDVHSDLYVPFKMGIRIYGLTDAEVKEKLRFYHLKKFARSMKYLRYL